SGPGRGLRHQPPDRVGSYCHDPAHQAWRKGVDQHLPGPPDDQEARRGPYGLGQGLAGVVGRTGQARPCDVRAVGRARGRGQGGHAPCDAQAPDEVQVCQAGGVGVMAKSVTATELREQSVEDLVAKLKEAKEELFNLRFQAATGQLDNHSRLRIATREIARIYTVLRAHELGIMPLSGESAEETKEAAE